VRSLAARLASEFVFSAAAAAAAHCERARVSAVACAAAAAFLTRCHQTDLASERVGGVTGVSNSSHRGVGGGGGVGGVSGSLRGDPSGAVEASQSLTTLLVAAVRASSDLGGSGGGGGGGSGVDALVAGALQRLADRAAAMTHAASLSSAAAAAEALTLVASLQRYSFSVSLFLVATDNISAPPSRAIFGNFFAASFSFITSPLYPLLFFNILLFSYAFTDSLI